VVQSQNEPGEKAPRSKIKLLSFLNQKYTGRLFEWNGTLAMVAGFSLDKSISPIHGVGAVTMQFLTAGRVGTTYVQTSSVEFARWLNDRIKQAELVSNNEPAEENPPF
jgi:hypothetical protein